MMLCLHSCNLIQPPPIELSARIEQKKLILQNHSSDTIYYWKITRSFAMVANYSFQAGVERSTPYIAPNKELTLTLETNNTPDELWITWWKKGKPLTQDTYGADFERHITIPIGK